MFSLTNLWCVQSVIHMLAPQLSVVSLVISVPMSLALLYSECKFNCNKMQSIMENDATQYWAYPALQSTLYALVWLNGFANGWIALGDLHHLPIITQWLVVAIGSTVSFAVMKSNLKEINKIIFNPTENQYRLVPVEAKDQVALVEILGKTGIMIFGAYIIAYPIVLQQLLTIPMIAYPLLAGFVFTSATCTMDGVAWIRNQIENSLNFTWSTSNEQHLKADSLNNSKPEEYNTQEQTVYERVHTLFSNLYQNYGPNNASRV